MIGKLYSNTNGGIVTVPWKFIWILAVMIGFALGSIRKEVEYTSVTNLQQPK
jgi:hypothetical protein